jgi:hypothetical protein
MENCSRLTGELLAETNKAIQIVDRRGKKMWIPRSVIPLLRRHENHIDVYVQNWWIDASEKLK